MTASTGIAAVNISGRTVHSWSGIGANSTLSRSQLYAIKNSQAGARIRDADTLVIDEVSMLSGDTLEAIDNACRAARDVWHKPFGGLQVILVGDFFQLPPVIKNGAQYRFAFEAPAWEELDLAVCYITERHRQNDPAFLELLSSIRSGECDPGAPMLRRRLFDPEGVPDNIPSFRTHNEAVNAMNAARLAGLPGLGVSYTMVSEGDPRLVSELARGCQSPERFTLKDGSVVMFTRNDPAGRFVNGTTGVVVDACGRDGWPVVETRGGSIITADPMAWEVLEPEPEERDIGRPIVRRVLARITQVPLRLGWAITVHKSQGMSLDAAVMDLSGAFEYGQGYVALSRVRSLEGLHLLGWNERALQVHPAVLRKDFEFRAASNALSTACGRCELRKSYTGPLCSTLQR